MTIVQGDALITASDKSTLRLTNLQCRLDTDAPAGIKGRVQLGTALVQSENAPLLRLDNFLAEGKTNLSDPLAATPHLSVSGALHLPSVLERLRLQPQLSGRGKRLDSPDSVARRVD